MKLGITELKERHIEACPVDIERRRCMVLGLSLRYGWQKMGGGGAILGAKSTTSDRDVNTDWLRHFAKDIRKIRNSLFLHYQTLNVYTWDNLINPFTRAKLVMYRLKLAPQFLSPSMKSFINVTIQIKAINERLSK